MTVKYAALLAAVVVDASNKYIQFEEGGFLGTITLTEGTWYLRGDGASDDFCVELKRAMEVPSTNVYSVVVTYSTDPSAKTASVVITRTSGANTFRLQWASVSTTFDPALLGFAATTPALGTSFTSTLSPTSAWLSSSIIQYETIGHEWDASRARRRDGSVRGVKRGGKFTVRTLAFQYLDARRATTLCATTTITDTVACLDSFLDSVCDGTQFEFHRQVTTSASSYTLTALSSSTLVGKFHTDAKTCSEYRPTRPEPGIAIYSIEIGMMAFVS